MLGVREGRGLQGERAGGVADGVAGVVELIEVIEAHYQLIHLFQIKIDVENPMEHIDVSQELRHAHLPKPPQHLPYILVLVCLKERTALQYVLLLLEVLAKLFDALVHVEDGVYLRVNSSKVIILLHLQQYLFNRLDRYFLLVVLGLDNGLLSNRIAHGSLDTVEQFLNAFNE